MMAAPSSPLLQRRPAPPAQHQAGAQRAQPQAAGRQLAAARALGLRVPARRNQATGHAHRCSGCRSMALTRDPAGGPPHT